MFKATHLLIATLVAIPQALAVCPVGQIAIGDQTRGSGGAVGVIWANDCGIIGSKRGEDPNFCGIYLGGSAVICNAGTQIPDTAQTPDGRDWGNCVASNEFCSEDSPVRFCCSPL